MVSSKTPVKPPGVEGHRLQAPIEATDIAYHRDRKTFHPRGVSALSDLEEPSQYQMPVVQPAARAIRLLCELGPVSASVVIHRPL